jgi:ArsR family transcriptional regulator
LHAAEIFKALSDPLRLRLIFLLTRRDELCVCHFTEVLDLPQSTVSRHLSKLRNLGLVETRREGKWVHYRLSKESGAILERLVPLVAELGKSEPQLLKDAKNLPLSGC